GVLADPTRRAILARLADERGLSVTELAEPFAIKLPAVVKHLDILDDAGLIRRSEKGGPRAVAVAVGSGTTADGLLGRPGRGVGARGGSRSGLARSTPRGMGCGAGSGSGPPASIAWSTMRRRRNARRNDDRRHVDPPHRRATRDRVRGARHRRGHRLVVRAGR